MFTDDIRFTVWEDIRQRDLRAFGHLLTSDVIIEAAATAGARVGKNALNILRLSWLAISAAMRVDQSFLSVLSVVLFALVDLDK